MASCFSWNVKQGKPDYVSPAKTVPSVGTFHPIADLKKGEELIAVYWGHGNETDEDMIQHAKDYYYEKDELTLLIERDHKYYKINKKNTE